MNIVFRVDASLDIGTGHVMRCLTLANALKEAGASCQFICREHKGNLIDAISKQGFAVHKLPIVDFGPDTAVTGHDSPTYARWLGSSQLEDAQACGVVLETIKPDWLVVDHYALDNRWETPQRQYCSHLLVIDDLADRPHDCDLLLDQNLGRNAEDYQPLVADSCQLLIGPEYALLRPEFAEWRPYSLKRRQQPQLKQLLITMGGVDKDNATSKVLEALAVAPLPDGCRIIVVMGVTAPWLEVIKAQADKMPRPTKVLVNVNNMAELMAESDLAIGAAGSTSWERCCLGLPGITLVLAENQEANALQLEAAKASLSIMTSYKLAQCISNNIAQFGLQSEALIPFVKNASNLVDGNGVVRTQQKMRMVESGVGV